MVCNTEMGLLAMWDRAALLFITKDNFGDYFVNGRSIVELMNKGLVCVWGTGGDGLFKVKVRVNEGFELTDEEKEIEDLSTEVSKLVVSEGSVMVGSPEAVGNEVVDLERDYIKEIKNLENGVYGVKVFYLYDGEAMGKLDEMSSEDADRVLAQNPDFDRTGYVVMINRVGDDFEFEKVMEVPQLG